MLPDHRAFDIPSNDPHPDPVDMPVVGCSIIDHGADSILKLGGRARVYEACLTQFVHETTTCPCPRVLDVSLYDPERLFVGFTMDRIPGVPLSTIWHGLSTTQKSNFIGQLKSIIKDIRRHRASFIGCAGRYPVCLSTDYFKFAGPFDSEAAFNAYRLEDVLQNSLLSETTKSKIIEDSSVLQKTSHAFVLTHGDISDRNIMVDNGIITGIIDWEFGWFFPRILGVCAGQIHCKS
jgi:hypothetical protein